MLFHCVCSGGGGGHGGGSGDDDGAGGRGDTEGVYTITKNFTDTLYLPYG